MHTLLCISDFPYALKTISFTGPVIQALGSKVSVLTVRPQIEEEDLGKWVVDRACESLPTEPTACLIRRGIPIEEILKEIDSGEYDMVAVGTHETPRWGERFLGIFARRIVAQSNISALVIRNPHQEIEHILVATTGTESSKPVVDTGANLAEATGAKVTLLYVSDPVPSMYSGLERIEETLPEMLQSDTPLAKNLRDSAASLRARGINAHIEMRRGTPPEEIILAAQAVKYDLLVVGATGHQGLDRLLYHEVTLQIVDQAPLPVMVVRDELGAPDGDQ
jgi:nucleotide-binding universal stress UspA family protein